MVIEEYKTIKENLINKLQQDNSYIESDKEYYYAIGQCISYMCNKYIHVNKLLKKNLVAKQLMLSKSNEQLRERLKKMLFNKCGNIIYMDQDKKFNNAFAMVIGYNPDSKEIDRDYLDFGYLENSILN